MTMLDSIHIISLSNVIKLFLGLKVSISDTYLYLINKNLKTWVTFFVLQK